MVGVCAMMIFCLFSRCEKKKRKKENKGEIKTGLIVGGRDIRRGLSDAKEVPGVIIPIGKLNVICFDVFG